MKNFYDLTAIDTDKLLSVDFSFLLHGTIDAVIQLNNTIVEKNCSLKFDLLSPITLTVNVKDRDSICGAVEIKKLVIEQKEILPVYLNHASRPTIWIDEIGLWQFEIPGPFYPWYHQITGQGFIA